MPRSTHDHADAPLTLDAHGLARLLQISPQTVRNRLSAGQNMPPSSSVGTRRVWIRDDVLAWLRTQRTPAPVQREPRGGGRPPAAPTMERRRAMLAAIDQRGSTQ